MKLFLILWLLQTGAPFYREDSIVNAASQTSDRFAPNSILTLYGTGLAFATAGTTPNIVLGIERLEVFYASPTQINFRLPATARPSPAQFIQVFRESVVGPRIPIRIRDVAPELFTTPANFLLALHADGALITEESPARPGETVVFYGTGFGPILANTTGKVTTINWLERAGDFSVIVNGEPLRGLYYVGSAPGFPGLYQVNYTLPEGVIKEPHPEIRVSAQGDRSREGTRLWFKPE